MREITGCGLDDVWGPLLLNACMGRQEREHACEGTCALLMRGDRTWGETTCGMDRKWGPMLTGVCMEQPKPHSTGMCVGGERRYTCYGPGLFGLHCCQAPYFVCPRHLRMTSSQALGLNPELTL
jgi:hypothetical protein